MPPRDCEPRRLKWRMAVDMLGHLPALRVTPSDIGDRVAMARPAAGIPDTSGDTVTLAHVDQGYAGAAAAAWSRTTSAMPEHSPASASSPLRDACSSTSPTSWGVYGAC